MAGDLSITFEIKADNIRITLKGTDERQIQVLADYGMSKDGCLFGRICQVKKGDTEGGPTEGDLFSFKVKQEKNKIVVSDLKVTAGGDDAKNLIEGDYEKK
jgi:pectin methylesterase-like acyl-CoA thioesterase